MRRKEYSNQEKLVTLSKAYINPKGIACLLEIGLRPAQEIHDNFVANHNLFQDRIPTSLFVKEMGIDEKRIQKYADMGL